jgi:hypothetical protein
MALQSFCERSAILFRTQFIAGRRENAQLAAEVHRTMSAVQLFLILPHPEFEQKGRPEIKGI